MILGAILGYPQNILDHPRPSSKKSADCPGWLPRIHPCSSALFDVGVPTQDIARMCKDGRGWSRIKIIRIPFYLFSISVGEAPFGASPSLACHECMRVIHHRHQCTKKRTFYPCIAFFHTLAATNDTLKVIHAVSKARQHAFRCIAQPYIQLTHEGEHFLPP